MRRMLFAMVMSLGLPAMTWAQHAAHDRNGHHNIPPPRDPLPMWSVRPLLGSTADGYPPRDSLPSFAIAPLIGPSSAGLPLPPIGLPLPSIGLQPPGDRHRPDRPHQRRGAFVWPQIVYVVPQALAPLPPPAPRPIESAPLERLPATGSLVLDVQPGSAQVFVDGYYVGTPDDINAARGELVLELGPHRVDLDAPGHEMVSFDVKVAADQPLVYRRALKRTEPIAPPAPVIPAKPRTFYLIPGCYLGNVPPKDAGLPTTCDIGRTVIVEIS